MSKSKRNAVRVAIAVVLVGGIAFFVHSQTRSGRALAKPKEAAAPLRAVPVLVAHAMRRDVPVWLEGLGTVAAWQQVTLKPQVDGLLERVYFKEGQKVRKGQILAQIDPRPFQAQLAIAEGALARDTAMLQGNKRNLDRYRLLDKRDLIPKQQVDDQSATVGQNEGTVILDRAQIQQARLNLEYARIRSPLSGIAGVRQVDPGNLVRGTDTI